MRFGWLTAILACGFLLSCGAGDVAGPLTLPATAPSSSGEAIVVAFRGRPDTRSFGQRTGGLSTANQHYPLNDGAWLLLTVSVFADRTGQLYGQSIAPDQVVNAPEGEGDPTLQAAIDWLVEQPACKIGE